jgi:RNA polymerase sigma-70 factor (ECF subfamily)
MAMCEVSSPVVCNLDPDLALVNAARDGEVSAFEELIHRYDRKLFRLALGIVHNQDDAQEVVQDAFVKAYRNLERFREDAKFATWLFRIAVNESLIKLRRRRGPSEVSIDADDFDADTALYQNQNGAASWAENPEDLYNAAEFREILSKALQKLSPALKVVFILRDIEERSILQTAEILHLTENAVKSRLSRARARLRDELSQYFRQQA